MPELPHFNPSVSVFHFTSKVSSAKIAKYKLATERGMVVTQGPLAPTKETSKTAQRSASTSHGESAKRPRLRLNVRNPSFPDGDTIAVAAPQPPPAEPPAMESRNSKKRAWSDAFKNNHESRASPASSSALSSCDSDILAKNEPLPRSAKSKMAREGYGDFMSYYVLDDDHDDNGGNDASNRLGPAKPAMKASRNTTAKTNAPPHTNPPMPQQPLHQNHPPRHYPQPQYRPPAPGLAIAPVAIDIRLREPDSVPIMILKLEALSAALTDFGGVPPIPRSPGGEEEKESPVDSFLAMFGEAKPDEKRNSLPLNIEDLEHSGSQDLPLTYGIQFIMNALKSWAEQRIAAQISQQGLAAAKRAQAKGSPTADMREGHFQTVTPTNLFDTPEGRAISAFRAVVESGCLRVNAVMPMKLSRALRHLYMQIDHLINQTPKGQPQWRCLSYVAQIEANRARIEKWRDAQARAQEETIRQHQLSHQQMMRQMGLPDHLTSTMFYHQSGDHETPEHERSNSSTDLVRLPTHPRPNFTPQPHLIGEQGIPNIMCIPGVGTPHGLPYQQPQAATHAGYSSKSSSAAFLPRSGQSMKFSFAPTNNAAVQAFGAQAFPPPIESASTKPGPAAPTRASHAPGMPAGPKSFQVGAGQNPHVIEDDTTTNDESSASPPPMTSTFAAINRPLVKQ